MKKCLSFICAMVFSLCSVICVGCQSAQPKMDVEYYYKNAYFEKAEGLTLEDVSSLIPLLQAKDIQSISDLEKFIRDNIHEYSIVRATENGNEKISTAPLKSLLFSETQVTISSPDGETTQTFNYIRKDNVFTLDNGREFYFSKGQFHYDLELSEGFTLVYNYSPKSLF